MQRWGILVSLWWLCRCWRDGSLTSFVWSSLMNDLLNKFFRVPRPPDLDLGWGGRLSGATTVLRNAFEACYFEGVKDGFMAGLVVALLVVIVIFALRHTPASAVSNAIRSM